MKIRKLEPFVVSLPLLKPIKMAGVEIRAADNVLVRIEADNACTGWGESASAPTMTGELVGGISAGVRYLAPLMIGRDAEDIEGATRIMSEALYGNASAKAAIEMALHDLLGRARGVPIHVLLGGLRRNRVAALRMLGSGNTEADCAEAARRKAEGFVSWKIKVGVNDPEYDADRTRRICEVLGSGHLISADANQGWSVTQAIEYLRRVDGCGLDFLEQPVAGRDLAGMAQVARSSRVPLSADEGLHGLDDIRHHHERSAARGGSLKTIKFGGLRPVKAAALLCQELGMKVNLACKIADSSIGTAALLQLAGALPALDWGVSLSNQYLGADVTRNPPAVITGHAAIPMGPGLGIDVDEALVKAHLLKLEL